MKHLQLTCNIYVIVSFTVPLNLKIIKKLFRKSKYGVESASKTTVVIGYNGNIMFLCLNKKEIFCFKKSIFFL